MNLKALFDLIRPFNCFMAGFAAIIGAILAGGMYFPIQVIYAFLGAFLVCGGGQAINDVFDLEIDKKINPSRAIASGKISANQGMFFSAILYLIGLGFAFLINFEALAIALVIVFLLSNYSMFMKKTKIFGNFIVSMGTAAPLIFGASLYGAYDLVLLLAVSAFFANYAREVTKDFADLNGDKGIKETLPMIWGNNARHWIAFSYFIAIALVFYVFFSGMINSAYFFSLILLSSLVFLYCILLNYKNEFIRSHKLSKFGMLIALIGFLLGGIFG
ncbi:MAG: UbiA family prenyltransferase [Candidatus Diapherotrites archaeon]